VMMVRLRTDLEHTSQLDRTSTSQVTMKRGLGEQQEEAEDLGLLARAATGVTEEELGLALHLSSRTIHHRLERLRERLGVRNRIELAAWAGARGLYPGRAGVVDEPAWRHTLRGSEPPNPCHSQQGTAGSPPPSHLVPVGVYRGWEPVSTGTQDQPRAAGTGSSTLRPASA
jgi:DNA-binding CsgD family transcriptional regulator